MIQESDNMQELKVHFYPELFLQRRIWILNILRKESITRVLDVGCGEGQLLSVLCQPAPWLTPPPSSVLTPIEPPTPNDVIPPSPVYNDDDIPNLHMTEVHGLDVSSEDLAFAVDAIALPKEEIETIESPGRRWYNRGVQRWEELSAKVWKGGLEVVNEEFVDMECIVAMEVIEHLTEDIFPAFAPMLLGVYHPKFFLVTTPSYTFNARFTPPDAPKSVRRGFPDPTGRTDRIFRHNDHKFEWTKEEFVAWCDETAKEWGYDLERTSIGRPLDLDPWGRDEELEGATSVVAFRRREEVDSKKREERGRARIQELAFNSQPHEALASHKHLANSASMKPASLEKIGDCVKVKMEEFREAFMRVEEIWFEPDVATMCGGWIELLVRAVEESPHLNLKRDVDGVLKKHSNMWSIELIGGVANPSHLWPAEGDTSSEFIPVDWTPGEGPHEGWEESDADGSTGVEGDVSANTSDDDGEDESDGGTSRWKKGSGWNTLSVEEVNERTVSDWARSGDWGASGSGAGGWGDVPHSANSSTAGWDGDESDDTTG
ncbi:hypothetical protein GALMADRAFT_67638 [Galerina marginata CBS 339.88]|uniref:Small RNA 2'-O-methyltransferase n=1 Tax=Galerina marginata (strain CBS 339.88) TaxID=685588 RepID=A0A067TAJ8_GALM3|nr:hypothetical protein GALMADRAFT_67638 [Galerina marginata CBS 339.88]